MGLKGCFVWAKQQFQLENHPICQAKSLDFCKAQNFWLLFFMKKVTEDKIAAKRAGQYL
jgi:hypothetical protein